MASEKIDSRDFESVSKGSISLTSLNASTKKLVSINEFSQRSIVRVRSITTVI